MSQREIEPAATAHGAAPLRVQSCRADVGRTTQDMHERRELVIAEFVLQSQQSQAHVRLAAVVVSAAVDYESQVPRVGKIKRTGTVPSTDDGVDLAPINVA